MRKTQLSFPHSGDLSACRGELGLQGIKTIDKPDFNQHPFLIASLSPGNNSPLAIRLACSKFDLLARGAEQGDSTCLN